MIYTIFKVKEKGKEEETVKMQGTSQINIGVMRNNYPKRTIFVLLGFLINYKYKKVEDDRL